MTPSLPFHVCRRCHQRAGTWRQERKGRTSYIDACIECGEVRAVFLFPPEKPQRMGAPRKLTRPPIDAITASADIPSRQIRDWPKNLVFADK